jgi:hypothetical protein
LNFKGLFTQILTYFIDYASHLIPTFGEYFLLICIKLFVYCSTDVTPPTIQCPENIVMGTDPDEDYATVSWTVPIATGMLAVQRNLYIFQSLNQIY